MPLPNSPVWAAGPNTGTATELADIIHDHVLDLGVAELLGVDALFGEVAGIARHRW